MAIPTRPNTSPRPDPQTIPPRAGAPSPAATGRIGAAAAIVGLAAAAWLYLGGGYPNADTAYAVVWGHELAGGAIPDYGGASTPTPHPLATGFGTLAALLGGGAYDALAVLAFLSYGGLIGSVYALGRQCYSWRVGLLGALIMGTSFTVLSRTAASYFDVLTVALILLAALLEASGRRGAPVLAVLGVAGLQRPEAWLLAAGYWLYLAPGLGSRERLRFAVLAAAAPLVWLTADLIVTGNPFYAFSGARSAAQKVVETSGPSESVLSVTVNAMREIIRLPVLLGGVVGGVLGVAFLRARSRVPLALLAVGLGTFVGLGLGGLPLVDRFLFLPAAALSIFFGVAATGWMDDPNLGRPGVRVRRLRAAWVAAGVVLLIGLALSVPAQIDRLQVLRDQVRLRVSAIDDLRALAESQQAATPLRRCGRIYLPNGQLIPILSYALDRTPRDLVASQGHEPPRRGVYLEARAELLAENAFFLRTQAGPSAPAGFDRVAESRYWTVRARGCRRGPI